MVRLLPIVKSRDQDKALKAFRDRGGMLRTRDLMALSVHTDVLYALRREGRIIELGRGLMLVRFGRDGYGGALLSRVGGISTGRAERHARRERRDAPRGI